MSFGGGGVDGGGGDGGGTVAVDDDDDDDDAIMGWLRWRFRYKPATEDQLMKAFQTLDTEGQGYLTQDQLSKLMMEEG